ncbi:MAG: iron-containing alcohol dehydrogenase [Oscillospiraceae bacterium]
MNTLNFPKKVYFKTGCTPVALKELRDVYHCKRAFLVTDPSLYKSGVVAPVVDLLRRQNIRVAEFFGLSAVPTFAEIRSAQPKLFEFEPDVIIGVGGSNVMSAAKALQVIYEDPQVDLAEAAKDPSRIPQPVKSKLVLLAADFSCGGQNSVFATLRDDAGVPCVLASIRLQPEISVTDADYTASLTAEQVRASALDTLSRSIRAYADEGCNEYTQGLLREAVGGVLRYLKDAENGCPVAREHLLNAASLAGAAYGSVTRSVEAEAPLFPTAAEKKAKNARVEELAQSLGYADAAALSAACEALR